MQPSSLCVGATPRLWEPAWHSNARKRRRFARGILAADRFGTRPAQSQVQAAQLLLSQHHGTAKVMGGGGTHDKAGGKPKQKHKDHAWLCQSCTDVYGYPRYVFPDKVNCWTCNRSKPHKPKLYGSRIGTSDAKNNKKGSDAKKKDATLPAKTPL